MEVLPMTEQMRTKLGEYLLGLTTPSEREQVEREVAASSTGKELQRDVSEALARWAGDLPEVALASAQSAEIRDTARARLLAMVGSVDRFRPFFIALGKIFGLDQPSLREVLGKIDDPAAYQVSPMPGVRYFHFAPGSASGFAEAGIVRVAKGAVFPRHQHLGPEVNFVLEGTMLEGGRADGPGTARWQNTGSTHDYCAGAARDLVLVAGHCGVTFVA
jgi:hypothetical protein